MVTNMNFIWPNFSKNNYLSRFKNIRMKNFKFFIPFNSIVWSLPLFNFRFFKTIMHIFSQFERLILFIMLKNAILYILISILHILSLEIKFLSNLFNIPFGYIYFNSLFFSRQEFLDFLIINLHSTITYLILLYIYFSLF